MTNTFPPVALKNVEVNTISSSMGFLSDKLSLLRKWECSFQHCSTILMFLPNRIYDPQTTNSTEPSNGCFHLVCDGLIQSFHKAKKSDEYVLKIIGYFDHFSESLNSSIAIMLVQDNEKNFYDQQGIVEALAR